MANKYGLDLGQAFSQAEGIKGQRINNAANQLTLDERNREIAARPAREAAEAERRNVLTGLRKKSAGGDKDAANQLISLDPENGPKFMEAVYKADDRELEAMKRNVDEMGRISGFVLQGKTPEEQQQRYMTARSSLPQELQAKLPPEYNPNFMSLSLSKATVMDKILENPKVITMGDQDIMVKAGFEQDRATNPTKLKAAADAKTSGSGGGVKSADESLMYRQSVELLGGLFDDQGNVQALDPTLRGKVQGIATEATKIFTKGGVTRTEAVKQAAKKFGVDVNDVPTATSGMPGFVDDMMQGMEPAQGQAPQQPAPTQTPQYQDGATAVNPSTGEKLILQNGQWVPVTQ